MWKNWSPILVLLLSFSLLSTGVHAQGTAFTYQGRLNVSGAPSNGNYDISFGLYSSSSGGSPVTTPITNTATPVSNGLFTVTLNYGSGIFTGNSNWLELVARTNGSGAYTIISPRQLITPSPYAMFATSSGNLSGTLPTTQLTGAIQNANLPSAPTFSGTVTAASFTGNGANLTSVNSTTLNGLRSSNYWQLGGNTFASGQFIGSANNQPVEIWVNASRALRIEPGTTTNGAPNIIGGSSHNFVSSGVIGATIAGGGATNFLGSDAFNSVTGNFGTISGGRNNSISLNEGDFIGGGENNLASSFAGVVAGGIFTNPNGAACYATGNRASLPGNNPWTASVGWFENTSTSGTAAPALRVVCDGGTNTDGALSVSSNGKGLIAEFGNSVAFVVTITNDGTIYSKGLALTSDRNAKENFAALDGRSVLAKVASLPVTEWNYKDDTADKKHIGPVAQDFEAAFGLNGGDDKHISVVDESGIALAAIQGLNQKVESENTALRAENKKLKDKSDSLETRLARLERLLDQKQ